MAKPFILELGFDASQVTQSLQYNFFDSKGTKCEKNQFGTLAGTFNFEEGAEILVRVVASAENDPESDQRPDLKVGINNCTLVSIKSRNTTNLSFFESDNACSTVSDWGPAEVNYNPGQKRETVTITANQPLLVTAKNGQWKISGYLSVTLCLNGNEYSELYFFDPEGTAGGGGGFGPP